MTANKSTARRFVLERSEDVSGTSGTGIVAEGTEYSNGYCTVVWLSPLMIIEVAANLKVYMEVHGHGGKTKVVWIDP